MPPFGEKTPLRGRALRALLAALALAVALIAPSALLPQTAFATTASELGGSAEVSDDEPWLYASREDTSDVAVDDLMSATHYTPSFNVFDFHFDFGLCVSDFLYGLSAQAASVLSSWADEFMAQISTGDMFDVNLAGGDYASAYRIVLDVAERVVVPVSGGFLGLAFVFSLMSFGRDAGMGGRHGTDLFASYAWIAVKYLLVQTAIVHGVRIMRAIFEVVTTSARPCRTPAFWRGPSTPRSTTTRSWSRSAPSPSRRAAGPRSSCSSWPSSSSSSRP